jgi:uncharacterized protein
MKIFRTDLHIGLNNKLFEISSASLGLVNVRFTEDKITCIIHSEITAHGYYLKGMMAVSTQESCDRCLIDFGSKREIKFTILLTSDTDLVNNDEQNVIYFNDQVEIVDISPVMAENLLLDRPLKKLCIDDCKGLCPCCGCNKNEKNCACTTEINDSRWKVLKNLN